MMNDKNYSLSSKIIKRTIVIGVAACFALMFSSASLALKTDRDQPVDIDADEVDIDFKTGKRTFNGNVRVIQGTLRIKADKIVAQYKDGELVDATAYGTPAKFRQRPDGKPDDVEGEGNTIYVNQANNSITLKKQAALKQGFDTARGQEIFYNMANDTLKIKNKPRPDGKKKKPTVSAGNTEANTGRQKDDDFFNDKPAPKKTSETESSTTTESETPEVAPVAERDSSDKDKLPEKLILPKKRTTTTTSDSGRSRLIIVPK